MQADMESPGSPGDVNGRLRIGWAFDHLHGLVEAHVFQRMADTLHGGDMSFSQLNAIYRLYRYGPQTIAEIANGADLSHNAASRMVERLVQSGLVERREVATDRRQKRVTLTPTGVEQLRDMQRFTAETYAALLSPVPTQSLRRLAAALEEVRCYLPVHPMSLEHMAQSVALPPTQRRFGAK